MRSITAIQVSIMRPCGPTPAFVADEVGVEIGHAQIVHQFPFAGVVNVLDCLPVAVFAQNPVVCLQLFGGELALFVCVERVFVRRADHLAGHVQVQHTRESLEHFLHALRFNRPARIEFATRIQQVPFANLLDIAIPARRPQFRTGCKTTRVQILAAKLLQVRLQFIQLDIERRLQCLQVRKRRLRRRGRAPRRVDLLENPLMHIPPRVGGRWFRIDTQANLRRSDQQRSDREQPCANHCHDHPMGDREHSHSPQNRTKLGNRINCTMKHRSVPRKNRQAIFHYPR